MHTYQQLGGRVYGEMENNNFLDKIYTGGRKRIFISLDAFQPGVPPRSSQFLNSTNRTQSVLPFVFSYFFYLGYGHTLIEIFFTYPSRKFMKVNEMLLHII